MSKRTLELLTILVWCALGAGAFGVWQWSIWAGVWMWVTLVAINRISEAIGGIK